MKFTYTYTNEKYTETVEYKITEDNKVITNKIRLLTDNNNVNNK